MGLFCHIYFFGKDGKNNNMIELYMATVLSKMVTCRVSQKYLLFSISNFSAFYTIRNFILLIFNSPLRQLLKIAQDFKNLAIFGQVGKEILTVELNKMQQNYYLIKLIFCSLHFTIFIIIEL